MGKHSRVKASNDKKRQHHSAAAAVPQKSAADADGNMPPVRATSPTSAEEVQHLRTLNIMLAKQMVEDRQERDQDRALLSEIECGALRAALAAQLSQQVGRVACLAEERGRIDGAALAGREMEGRLAAAEAKWVEAVAVIEKEKAATARLGRDLEDMAQDKVEVEKNLRTAALETEAVRGSLQEVKKALEHAKEENEMFKKDMRSLVLERDEIRKNLDVGMEKRKVLDIKISDLEKSYEEARQALNQALLKCTELAEDGKGKKAAVELLMQEKSSLEKSLAEALQMVDDLRRQMGEALLAKDQELNRVVLERDEARVDLRLRMQEMQGLVARARDVARDVVELALSQCWPPEEMVEEWKRDSELLMGKAASEKESGVVTDALRLLNRLSGEMVQAIQAKGAEQEETKTQMEKVISMKEEELADLTKANVSLNSELAILLEVHESLTAEEEGLRSQVAELNQCNEYAQKMLDYLRVELKKQLDEKEENTRTSQSLVESYQQRIEDLTRKMEKAAEERDKVERVKGEQQDEIFGLQERVAQLTSGITALQALSSNHVQENELLLAEKNAVLGRLIEQTQKAEAQTLELKQLAQARHAIEQELRELQTAHAQLLEEKQQMGWQVASLGEEKAEAQRSLADAERHMQDAERKARALRELAQEALSMMKGAAAEAVRGGGGEGKPVAVVEAVEDIGPFAAAMEAIRAAVGRREKEMEEVKEKVKQQERANARWVWISSAVAGASATALASIAFVTRGR